MADSCDRCGFEFGTASTKESSVKGGLCRDCGVRHVLKKLDAQIP